MDACPEYFTHKGQQVSECLKYFGVSSVAIWNKRYTEPVAAFRASNKFEKEGAAVSAWLRQGERQATEINCKPFDKAKFMQALPMLRALSNEAEPETFVPKLTQACAELGVAVVFAPTPRGCPVSGATRWLAPDKALLMLSLRHATNDHLWFAFFHEVGHILLHGKKMLFLEIKNLDDQHEQEADKFASNLLIPPADAKRLPELEKTYAAVKQFASKLEIPPAIVVGRMQREQLLTWGQLNKCKVRYHWH